MSSVACAITTFQRERSCRRHQKKIMPLLLETLLSLDLQKYMANLDRENKFATISAIVGMYFRNTRQRACGHLC